MVEAVDYEKRWGMVALAVVLLILFVIAASVIYFGFGVPSHQQVVDPKNLPEEFQKSVVREVSPEKYEVYITARQFAFTPRNIKIPRGAEVTFYLTSVDVLHGFEIVGTNVNTQIIPGYVNSITYKFDKPGEYLFICNEYCGEGHHLMFGKIIVE